MGINYVIGGTFNDKCEDCYVKLETHNYLERKLSPNVMGYIRGAVEPDRYSSNGIRKTQNEHLNIFCQNLNSQ